MLLSLKACDLTTAYDLGMVLEHKLNMRNTDFKMVILKILCSS